MMGKTVDIPAGGGGEGAAGADAVGKLLLARHMTLCVAESLTGGLLTSRFASGSGASRWLDGGVVAYSRAAKVGLLDAGDGPLVSERTARQMLRGAMARFGAGAAVAVTGAGGPGGEDGAEPGEVWIGVRVGTEERVEQYQFSGEPAVVCEKTCLAATDLLRALLEEAPPPRGG
jgi:nicotinamide-nucleotide amidase